MNPASWAVAGGTIAAIWAAVIFLGSMKFRSLLCKYRGHQWAEHMEPMPGVMFVRVYCEFCGRTEALKKINNSKMGE